MPEYKNITIRIPKNGSLYQEVNRRREEGNGSWGPAVQDLLNEGWHTLLLQRVASTAVNRANAPQAPQISPAYVKELETALANFLTMDVHPRYIGDQSE